MSTLRAKIFGYDIILTTHRTHDGYETSVFHRGKWWDIGDEPVTIQTAAAVVEGLNPTGYEWSSKDKWMILTENYKDSDISENMREWANTHPWENSNANR